MTRRALPLLDDAAPRPASPRPVASPMVYETVTSLPPADVIARAKTFFSERVSTSAAFPEKEGPTFLVLRGQGGEEIALNAHVAEPGTRVRASTLFFDQVVDRFLGTLPPA